MQHPNVRCHLQIHFHAIFNTTHKLSICSAGCVRRSTALLESAIRWHPSTILTSLGVLDFYDSKKNIKKRHETSWTRAFIDQATSRYPVAKKNGGKMWISRELSRVKHHPTCSAEWILHLRCMQSMHCLERTIHPFCFIISKDSAKL